LNGGFDPVERGICLAGIIDHKGMSVEFQGLRGMNFLKEVDYS